MNGNAHRKWEMGSHVDLPAAPVEEELELRKEMRNGIQEERRSRGHEGDGRGDERERAAEMGNGISPGSAGSGLVGVDGRLMVESLSPNELPSDALSGSRKGTGGESALRAS